MVQGLRNGVATMAELSGKNVETVHDHVRNLCGQDIEIKFRDGHWCALVHLGRMRGYCHYAARRCEDLVREIVRDLGRKPRRGSEVSSHAMR